MRGTVRRSVAETFGRPEQTSLDAPGFEAWRPPVEPKWDVLRRGQLPPTDGMAFNHRINPGTREERVRCAVRVGVALLLLAWIVSGLIQLAGDSLTTPGVLG